MKPALPVALVMLSALLLTAPLRADGYLLSCSWSPALQIYTCSLVWWPYYEHLTSQPDFCQWQDGDTVWYKWDANYTRVESWYGVPEYDLTTPPPPGYDPVNYTVVGASDGPPCQIRPF